MSEQARCPACGATDVTPGRFVGAGALSFLPAGLRFWTLRAHALPATEGGAPHACAACGLVWARVDPARLRRMLQDAGTDETRARFGGAAGSRPAD
jgi:hypothetical protein